MARVLLAEADRRIGGFIAGILVEFGHDVTLCGDVVEADARLAVEPIDVVLSDFGAEARLGRSSRARGIPMLTLSGVAVSPGRAGSAPPPFVDKPFRFADLRRVLDAVAACAAEAPARLPNAA
jgi:DNA-binding response OmpR family regulator